MEIELSEVPPSPQLPGQTAGENEPEISGIAVPDPHTLEQEESVERVEMAGPEVPPTDLGQNPTIVPAPELQEELNPPAAQLAWQNNPIVQAVEGFWERNRARVVGCIRTVLFLCFFGFLVYRFFPRGRHYNILTCRKYPEIVVAADGTGDFTSVSTAVDAAPDQSFRRTCIFIRSGLYKESIVIPPYKRRMIIVGEDMKHTIIESNSSATVTLDSSKIVFANITFRNAGGPNNDGVVLNTSSSLVAFYRCCFASKKSTILFAQAFTHYFSNCEIHGAQNVVSGDAIASFQNCSVYIGQPGGRGFNVVTLQQRMSPGSSLGFVFDGCKLLPDLDSPPVSNSTYLGIVGSDYSRVVFMKCFLSRVVNTAGWISNDNKAIQTVYFAEFNNSGPGAATDNRIKWPGYTVLDAKDASNFTVGPFFGDEYIEWLVSTGVPYWEDM